MTPLQAIRANAQLVLEQLGPISDLGEQFGYNLESLRYVEGFIERFRARTGVTEATIERWVQVFGSFWASASSTLMVASGGSTRGPGAFSSARPMIEMRLSLLPRCRNNSPMACKAGIQS